MIIAVVSRRFGTRSSANAPVSPNVAFDIPAFAVERCPILALRSRLPGYFHTHRLTPPVTVCISFPRVVQVWVAVWWVSAR